MENVEVPEFWSQTATDILAQKYFRKTDVPKFTKKKHEENVPLWLQESEPDYEKLKTLPAESHYGGETSARQVFSRIAGCWTYWGWKAGYFESEDDAKIFNHEIEYMLASQMAAPNSPQWFNTGLKWAYGITKKPQGHHYVDPATGTLKTSSDAYTRPQVHACFIQSLKDDLVNEGGIMDLWTREARLFKYGSGTGTNFSKIRGGGEPLSGGGRSSGLMSFLKIGDTAAGSIKSGGTTRRAAKMVILNADHPDIMDFVNWKRIEEQKVAALVSGSRINNFHLKRIMQAWYTDKTSGINENDKKSLVRKTVAEAKKSFVPPALIARVLHLCRMGRKDTDIPVYDTDWQSQAYTTVAGQNSNNSVRVTTAFMEAVKNNSDWNLYDRVELEKAKNENRPATPANTIKARALWEDIGFSAWSSADPGLQFHDTINDWHTCPAGGPINASNPCGEYMFLDDSACNLASLNLLKFYDFTKREFMTESFRHAVNLWTIVLEISVYMAQFPGAKIAELSYEYRTLGLGFANLGSLLMAMAVPYDSPKALAISGALSAMLTMGAYKTSALMAQKIAPFKKYSENKNTMLRVLENHRKALHNSARNEYTDLHIPPMGVNSSHCPENILSNAISDAADALEYGHTYGFRNAQVTAIAPTGTIGLVMDCDTTGIEPEYSLIKFKKLSGGGYFKIVNNSFVYALEHLNYTEQQIQSIISYVKGHGSLIDSPEINKKSLKESGFTDDMLKRIEKALADVLDIKMIFNKYYIGDDYCKNELHIDEAILNQNNFNLLSHLGFSEQQIKTANYHICGHQTIEGAPHLKETHYPIFDCAGKCGPDGRRFIAADGHIRMMAAVQPFISGAISKTINLPHSAGIEDVLDCYTKAWQYGLKGITVYRDGSKLSQPLASSMLFEEPESSAEPEDTNQDGIAASVENRDTVQLAEKIIHKYITGRNKLPYRRKGYTQKSKIGGQSLYLRTGEYANGQLGEIFIDMHREGAAFRSLLSCFAIAISLGLQHGVPLEEYVDAFTFTKFEPSGVVTGNEHVKMASSIIDYIFRELAVTYLGRYDLAHVVPEQVTAEMRSTIALHSTVVNNSENDVTEEARATQATHSVDVSVHNPVPVPAAGFSGDICRECGSMMTRAGGCQVCPTCGGTSGCG